ncbi:hypothetical protein L1987_86805 [Smallanthus sonchifolius]|uniref:Uncharacterized protein n=1 Tax=Smallanthus sonchifolius TaxID=185202 RepID=A0ACB8Y0E8_9ASTR|nr:hypothetical protein L1987_86805 [Smallanthus sonchifolius]
MKRCRLLSYLVGREYTIFRSIFVKILEEVDPCVDLTDDDIQTAIQNATGPRSALFVPEVPFEVLIRRHIARLLDLSVQCARFVYDELVKVRIHINLHAFIIKYSVKMLISLLFKIVCD